MPTQSKFHIINKLNLLNIINQSFLRSKVCKLSILNEISYKDKHFTFENSYFYCINWNPQGQNNSENQQVRK